MNAEMQLISRIIRTGDIAQVLEWGITGDDFRTDFGRGAFDQLYNFYTHPNTRGAVMGVAHFRTRLPNFVECDDPGMTTDALCVVLRQNRLVIEAKALAGVLLQNVEIDPERALAEHQRGLQTLTELGAQGSRDVRFSDAMPRLWTQYELAESGHALNPIVYPWPALNDETLGIAPDDYIVFYGRPKSMKSWILAFLIAHMSEQRVLGQPLRILVYTKEMGPDNIFKRIAACKAAIPYRELRRGQLTAEEKAGFKWVHDQSQIPSNRDNLIALRGSTSSSDNGTGTDTAAWFRSKVEKYRPHVAFIDGAYLLNTARAYSKDNARVQAISRELRLIPLDFGIPLIITFQATRAAAKHNAAELDEIAFSDAIGQDATAAFRVINEKSTRSVNGRDVNTILLGVAGSREWSLDGIRIVGEPAYDFSYIENVTTGEMLKAKENDSNTTGEEVKRTPANKETKLSVSKVKDAAAVQRDNLDKQFGNMTGTLPPPAPTKRKPKTK